MKTYFDNSMTGFFDRPGEIIVFETSKILYYEFPIYMILAIDSTHNNYYNWDNMDDFMVYGQVKI